MRPLAGSIGYRARLLSISNPVVHRWAALELDKVTELISRKIVSGERQMLVQVYLKRGAQVPAHRHEGEQLQYVLEGALRCVVGGEEVVVREGEVLVIPAGAPHQAEALADTFALDVFCQCTRSSQPPPRG